MVALALVALATPAHAQTVGIGERILAYDTEIEIGQDGVLTIVETIDYDFSSFERHGIYRDIPTAFLWEPDRRYERIYPLDAVFDTAEDVPEDVREDKRYRELSGYSIQGVADSLRSEFGDACLDVVVHSLANGPEVQNQKESPGEGHHGDPRFFLRSG